MSFNNKIKQLWNAECKTDGAKTLRWRAVRLLVGFLFLMLAFTFLSRAADSLSIAKVETQQPEQKVIEHRIEAVGQVTAKQEKLVCTESDLLVESVMVKQGQRVKAGEALFTVSMADLQKKIDETELAIRKMELENQDYVNQKEAERDKKRLDLQRAEEDYQNAERNGEAQVNAAREALEQSKQKLTRYYEEKNQRTQEDAQTDAEKQADEENRETEEALLADIKEKETLLLQAEQSMQESLAMASRAIEDLKTPDLPDSAYKINELEINQKKRELEKWKSLYEQQGKIFAESDSVVTKVGVEAGERTGDVAVCLADEGAGFQFVAQITKEEADTVNDGVEVSIKKAQGDSSMNGLTVNSLQVNAEDDSKFDVIVDLIDSQLGIGETATMIITKKSSPYPCCVPLQAVRSSDKSDYVLVLQEEETILGKVNTLRAVTVEILEKNERFAALSEESFGSAQEIVVDSDRAVEEGSRVRLDNKE